MYLLYKLCVDYESCLYTLSAAGVCLGMQCAVIEFARNVLHWQTANTTEVDPATAHPVVRLPCLKNRLLRYTL